MEGCFIVKRIIYILPAFIMLISMAACGNKTMSETNSTQSFSETKRTEEEQNQTSPIKTEDTSLFTAENESTASTSDESSNSYSPAITERYPSNNGMDSPEEVIEAYLDAFINFDSDAVFALFNLEEADLTTQVLNLIGVPISDVSSSPYWMQAGIYYAMMADGISDDDWLIRLENPTKSYVYSKDCTEDYLCAYEYYLEEDISDIISVEKAYMYDSVGLLDNDGYLYEFISDDINVICIDGKYYLSSLQILGLSDTDFWLYADIISAACEKERLDFEANAYSSVNAYPANAGMDSPEDVVNAYINAAKSDDPEGIYALFNTSECKWAAEVYDRMFMEEFGRNFPIALTKTDCLILLAKSDTLEYYGQTENIEFAEEMEEDDFFESIVEVYNVVMPFEPQEVKEYAIETDDMRSFLYIYSVNDKWYLSTLSALG